MDNSDNDLSSDDSDYNPEKNQEIGSESNESRDFDDEAGDDGDAQRNSTKKQKRTKTSNKTKSYSTKEAAESENSEKNVEIDPEEEKRKADAIWDEFLGETETPPEVKPFAVKASSSNVEVKPFSTKQTGIQTIKAPQTSQLFEFAGETVKIPTKVNAQDTTASALPKVSAAAMKRPSGGGLSSVLNQLTKKNKLSVLEKTKLDWDGFKSTEGINEELQTHNRGRDGFLERKDFLNRTDLRQFEIEKNLRMTRRK